MCGDIIETLGMAHLNHKNPTGYSSCRRLFWFYIRCYNPLKMHILQGSENTWLLSNKVGRITPLEDKYLLEKNIAVAKANTHLRVELEDRIRFETFISDISARFVKLPSTEVDNEIECALWQILDFFNVDRCGIMEVRKDEQFVRVTHKSIQEGQPFISPAVKNKRRDL